MGNSDIFVLRVCLYISIYVNGHFCKGFVCGFVWQNNEPVYYLILLCYIVLYTQTCKCHSQMYHDDPVLMILIAMQ